MDKYVRFSSAVAVLLILLMPVVCVYLVFANPIPVYPDPEPVISGQINYTSPMVEWVIIVFVSKYILKISWKNSYRMGFFALIVNIVVWIVIFSI